MSELKAVPVDHWNGSPLVPTGNPMIDAVGPASYADRADVPDLTAHGEAKIIPMRVAPSFSIAAGDPDPRGLPVKACDGAVAGTIADLWVDRSEPQIRYYEVKLAANGAHRLLPAALVQWPHFGLWGNDHVIVKAITAAQFANVPTTKRDDRITLLEEDKIMAYYAGGHLYATPDRAEPWI
ncbi:MAG: photosynthetic reaction center subunit H [Gemmatimonadaceae bacterium]